MAANIQCPFCNFETTYPTRGKILECLGECYSTYTIVGKDENMPRAKMRMVEIFFLDREFNLSVKPDEIDDHCEFAMLPTSNPDEIVIFAREKRVLDDMIDDLKKQAKNSEDFWAESQERLNLALQRFERNMKEDNYPKSKLLNELKALEKIVSNMTEKMAEEAARE